MKLLLIIALVFTSFGVNAQTVRQDANGNYVAVKPIKDSTSGKPTGKTFTDNKGNTYPVLISKNGKLYVVRISKTSGKPYNQYLKLD